MKKAAVLTALCLITAVVTGCVTAGNAPSDAEMIQSTLDNMKVALESKNIDLLMSTFSEDFYHPEVGGKAEGRELLQAAIDAGYLDDGVVTFEDMEIEMNEDGTATVYPVDLAGPPGAVSIELKLKKEEGGWLILELAPDGI
ncbi:MAG: nuclear transport factor 2 family protein [Candidatus Hydrogenedentes bacterium]|nr:nuclear transport factor 2 family protein [Candidatus Hydrogenedentota bacterium]